MSVTIAGPMDCSLNHHLRGCEAYLEEEQAKLAPDTHLLRLLCNTVRLHRDYDALHTEVLELAGRLIEAKMEIDRLRRHLTQV